MHSYKAKYRLLPVNNVLFASIAKISQLLLPHSECENLARRSGYSRHTRKMAAQLAKLTE